MTALSRSLIEKTSNPGPAKGGGRRTEEELLEVVQTAQAYRQAS